MLLLFSDVRGVLGLNTATIEIEIGCHVLGQARVGRPATVNDRVWTDTGCLLLVTSDMWAGCNFLYQGASWVRCATYGVLTSATVNMERFHELIFTEE